MHTCKQTGRQTDRRGTCDACIMSVLCIREVCLMLSARGSLCTHVGMYVCLYAALCRYAWMEHACKYTYEHVLFANYKYMQVCLTDCVHKPMPAQPLACRNKGSTAMIHGKTPWLVNMYSRYSGEQGKEGCQGIGGQSIAVKVECSLCHHDHLCQHH